MKEEFIFGTLFSSSKGNCSLFRLGDTVILFDAGRSAKYITDSLKKLGLTPDSVSAIFVTHPHTDHIAALKVWTKKYSTPVHAAGATGEDIEDVCAPGVLVSHPIVFNTDVGCVTVSSFPTSHDTRCSVGYRIKVRQGEMAGECFGISTDLGCVTDSVTRGLQGCRGIVLESNHDVDMLMQGPYQPEQKRRILSDRGHLSNETSAQLAVRLAEEGTSAFVLAHLSPVNNSPEAAMSCMSSAMKNAGLSPMIEIAKEDVPVTFTATDVETGKKAETAV